MTEKGKTWLGETRRLETDRLVLRRLTMEDAAHVFIYASDPEVTRYLRWVAHRNLADTREFLTGVLRSYSAGSYFNWGLELKQTGWVVGACALHCDPGNARAELGYVLGRDYWGRGLVPEAVLAVLRFAFTQTQLNRIEAFCLVEHSSSARVLEKCGFRFEGVQRERELIKGRFADMKCYAMLRGDFAKS